jgi:hypothetical protein
MFWNRMIFRFSCSAPWGIPPWQRLRVSSRFAGVGEIIPELTVALVDFEARPIDFNNLVTVHVFDLRRFPTHDELSYSRSGISLLGKMMTDSPYSPIYWST